MNLTGRKSGKVRVNRVHGSRSFALLLPTLLAWLLPSFANAAIVHEGTVTADSESDTAIPPMVSSLTVNSVTSGTDQLYIAAVAVYGDGPTVAVDTITGGSGLTWTLQKAQCSRRLNRAQVEVWQAYGSPGASFNVDITLKNGTAVVSAAVSRYSGADPTTPTEGADGSNTGGQGVNAVCDGFDEQTLNLSLSLTSSNNDSVLYVASHYRNKNVATPDAAYTQRASITNSDGGDGANMAVHDRSLATAGTDSADHILQSGHESGWDMAGLVINPAPSNILIGHWNFNEGSGQTIGDSSTSNNDGTLGFTASVASDDPTWACTNTALDFDGTDDEVKLGSVSVNDSAAFSISAWIKMSADTADKRTIYSEGNTAATEYMFLYVDDSTNVVKFYSESSGATNTATMTGTTNVEDDTWHLVTIVQRSKTDRELYVGTNSEATNTSNSGTLNFNTASIGLLRTDWAADPFKGVIDDVRIYNYALSTGEIATLNASPPAACGGGGGGSCPMDVSIAVSSDDAEEDVGGSSVSLTSSDLELINDGTNQEVGLRFINLDIPQGATITTAHVTFTSKSTISGGTPSLTFNAEAIDNAPTFASSPSNQKITTRAKTTASVNWVPGAWTAGNPYQSPELKTIIQEVVDRGGWSPNNALAIIVTGTAGTLRRAWSVDGGTPASLHVECSGGGGTPAVTSAVAEISPNDVTTSSTGNSFSYDIQATIGGGDTGVDTVTITVPGTFGAPTVTAVQDDGVGVTFTNNTAGNTIDLLLDTKITATSKITVLFDSDAPTSADATGKDFTSTVDDSGTGDAAQSTTEGNGDGDAGDANSWTVTTTDSAGSGGGACPAPGAGGWYPGGWLYRKPLSIGAGNVGSNLTDFPVLVSIASDTDLAADAQGDFDDILFTASDGTTKLSHEIEQYNEITGELIAWVKVPTVSSSADTVFYMYYGNGSATNQQDPTGVWTNGYAGVWHLKEDPSGTAPQMQDSTSNNLDGTALGSMTSGDQVGGQIAGALDFDGSNDYIESSDYDILSALSLSAWINWDAVRDSDGIFAKRIGAENAGNWALRLTDTSLLEWMVWSGINSSQKFYSVSTIPVGAWTHVSLTYDDPTDTVKVYVNGSLDNTSTSFTNGLADTPEPIEIATDGYGSSTINGRIDEARISSAIRSADWISAEYINQSDHDNFQSLCSEENEPASDPAVTSAVAEISPNDVVTSSTGNSFSYDILATMGGSDTGVDTVTITVPGTFGAPTVTAAQDDGVGVTFTNNTAGNTISLLLDNKITATSKITVLFNANAPGTQDLTGVDFTSTVDDSGTGYAAQATTEGNGDGDSGDLDSWTVTTTDAVGGACDVDTGGTYMEAENYTALVNGTNGEFSVLTTEAGYNGTGYIATPNANGLSGQRVNYTINFPTTGTYYAWIRGHATTTGDDSIYFGVDGAQVPSGDYFNFAEGTGWHWIEANGGAASFTISSAGQHTLNLWGREDDLKADGIYITQTPGMIPGGTTVGIPTIANTPFTHRINLSANDVEEVDADRGVGEHVGQMDLGSSDLEVNTTLDPYGSGYVGMRFTNVTIPKGATIVSAKVQFHVDELGDNSAVTATFKGEDADDAAAFSGTDFDLTNRTQTSASVNWAIPAWSGVHDEGANQLSDELNTIVQEIVDRDGWNSGNALVLMTTGWSGSGERTAESWDGENAAAPELQITYRFDAKVIDPSNCSAIDAVTSAVAEISPNDVPTNSTGNSFSYDIQATIGGSNTGVDRVEITVPGSFGAPTITGVQVDGSGVGYTNSTSGNDITIDLNSKVTASSKITVLFDSDAPTSQDLTGVDFTSTVDDSGTGDVAQATTEGNGDGDAGDNNSWTVTTTNGVFSCPIGSEIFSDGFESGNLSAWDGSSAETGDSVTASTDQARNGTYSLKGDVDTVTDAQAMVWTDDSGQTIIHAKVEMFLPSSFSISDHMTFLQFLTGWSNILALTIDEDLDFYMWNAVAAEAYGFGATPTVSLNSWHTWEMRATISDTVGEARVWLDGNLEITATNKNLGTNAVDRIATGYYWSAPRTEANTVYIDDAAICGTPAGGDHVYYSIGTNTADMKTGAPDISISGGTATLTVAQTGNIGVGDEIDYDADNKIAYIKSVTSTTEFELHTATGGVPANVSNVTVNTIKRAFNALGTAESGSSDASHLNTSDLTATGAAVKLTWVAYDDGDFTSNVGINGYTTDATYFITLTVADASQVASGVSQRHDGTAGSGVLLDVANLTSGITVNDDYTVVEWFETIRTGGANGRGAVSVADATNVVLDHLLIHDYVTGLASYGIKGADNSSFTARNCIVYDGQSSGIRLNGTSTATVENCTVYGITGTGISQDAGTLTVTNSISMGNSTDFSGGTQSYNMSSDGTAAGTGSLINKVTADQFVNIGAGTENLHLKAGSDAIDVGTDLSGSFSHDIDLDSRPIGAQWDIGADETSAAAGTCNVMMIVGDDASPSTSDTDIASFLASNSFTVFYEDDGDSTATFNSTISTNSITSVFISESANSTNLNTKAQSLATGVVTANNGSWTHMLLGSPQEASTDGTQINVVDNTHYITSPYATGNLTIFPTSAGRAYTQNPGSGGEVLAQDPSNSARAMLLAYDSGTELQDSSPAPARRVGFFADDTHPAWNSTAEDLLLRSLQWVGACNGAGATPAVTSAVAEITPNDVVTSSTGNSFTYDIQATIGGGDTGVNRIGITVPGTFGTPTVTGVQVDGSGVAYTDNTAGKEISVDLTTKVTASSKITVLFDADAPTTQDGVGVNFLSTVDDTGTIDVAQSTTEGNGDGDAGDNNSWTVTTTDAASGGACPVGNTIFSDDFEAGNLNAWDIVSTGTGSDSMAASTLQANGGSYSARAEVDTVSTARARVIEDFAGQTTISARAYFYLDPTWSTTDNVEVLYLLDTGLSQVLSAHIKPDLTVNLWNNVASENYLTSTTITKGEWHSIEIQAVINGASSEARLWFDDTLISEQTGINLGSNSISRLHAGYHWGGVQTEANTLYMDDVELCDVPMGPPGNLVGHWTFDEGSGQTAGDSSASNNDGTLGNTAGADSLDPNWACVAGGFALDFDGTDKEVSLGSTSINNSAAFTINAWIKMSADTADQRTIYSEGNTGAEEYLLLYVDDSTNHAKFYSVESGGSNYALFEGTSNVEDDAWHMITLVQRSKTDRELYVDGISEATNTQNAGTYAFDTASIGFLRASTWNADPFKGMIEDVRIYDYDLSTGEISSLAASPPGPCGANVLIIADDKASPGASDTALQAYLEGLGLTIFYADDDDAEYNTAISANNIDVVYISSSAFSSKISNAKVGGLTVGVVNANHDNFDDADLAADRSVASGTNINLVDNSHFITLPYSTGNFAAYSSGGRQNFGVSEGSGVQILAQDPADVTQGTLTVYETNTLLKSGTPAPARRVGTYADADFSVWTATTKDIIYRSLIWGSVIVPGDPAVTSAVAEISPNDVTTSSTGNAFSYDIQATISGGNTGVDRVEITVPGTFGAPTVTAVQVDGSGVAYTNNTSGNTISVDLTAKVTASSKITVLFDADAPTSADATGVDFTSTVDDSSTGTAAQATTEGNGDGNAGDNNSWTVTTTGGSGPSPLGRYCFNEAGSGTTPTTIFDDQANPVNASITYGTGMTWFTHGSGHLGLNAATDPHVGIASGVANGTKYSTNLDGATQATFSAVADFLPAGDTQRIGGFFRYGGNPSAYLMVNTDGTIFVRVLTQGAGTTSVKWPTSYEDGVRRAFHFVFDSDHATDSSRVRLYVNGVDQGAGTLTQGAWPTLGVGLNFDATDLDISFLNEPDLTHPLHGTVYHFAVYDSELTDAEISTDATALLADDDCGSNVAVTSAVAEISPNDVATSSTGNSFSYDIQATISGGDTGVNRVAITVPAGFGSVSVTDVQVDGIGVAYTDNTVGNAISVDLTTKVTASSKITILFDADAPTSEDLTGVDFTSTVDDSATGQAAQSTTEGNSDGDSGDSNSWTVTTTDVPVAVTNSVAEISPNNVQTSSTGNSFSYDIQATIGGSDTGVNRVAITVPGTFGAPTITGVQVNGSGVAYTDNTAGNTISVDLTSKVTATGKITVLFNSDAPTTEDLTGVAFTSTVDDSGTGQAAQATSQGNGDGDGGDNNSWVVTTSDIAGLVAHWDFDEGSGQTTADATGNGHTATLGTSGGSDSADPAWECVGNGYGLNFDGNDDIVNAGSGAALDDLEPFTFMAWVKPDSSDVGGVSQIVARGTGNGRWFLERDNTAPEVHAYEFNKQYDTSDLMRVASDNTVSYNVWQHVAVSWDGSDLASNIHIYKNGVETGYQTTSNGSTTKQSDAAIDLVMGNREDGMQGFTGLMDEVRIYDRVLSAGEIAALAAATPGSCANNAVSSAVAEISPNDVTTSSTGNSFEYDIQATVGGSNTGVNRVAITVPVSFGAPTVTDVKVDDVSVAFTDNTVGNAISVDLTTKVTASSKITVLFNADAPTTQDLTGMNFLSTVDDSGTGDAAQNTTEGNGDGDAGNNNSWTVTTTNAGGGACIAIDGTASTGSTETNSLQISHTTSGTDRLMLVGISINNNSNETVSSVTYNSIALTLVGADELDNDARVEIWRLTENDGLPTGTHNVDITFSADLTRNAVAGVMTFTGVDQTTPLGTFASATGTSTAASANVSSAVGELVYAIASAEDAGTLTTDAPANEQWNINVASGGNVEWGSGATDDGAASVNMSWTLSPADYWAAGGVPIKPSGSCNAAFTSAVAEISPNDVATSSTGNAFSYDIYATISGGDTGVNVISITVPGSFGVPTVTDVLVNSVSVPYTDNTSGNAISVVLTTKVTVSNRITVLFDADAPTTQNLSGVDFVSTVDDNGSSDPAQATTEGNGDEDAGDNNSWTVTTTDGGGGGADPVVNSTGNASDNNAGDGNCDTGGTNSQSDTECTLRAAIQEANASAGLDTITFNMPTTEPGYNASPLSYTINPSSALPNITDQVVINATSQSGFPGTPIVVLDGNGLGAVGLTLGDGADGSTIRGFVIRDFGDNGLEIKAGSDGNLIAGNYIGRLNVSGTDAGVGEENSVRGIEVLASNNTIGGTTAADRNVISGNGGEGIIIRSGASNTIVQGNYLGTAADGTTALGNDDEAIQIDTASAGTIIGGSAAGAGNVIGANGISSGAAISIGGDGSDNTVVQGNFIGTDASGTVDIGNIRSGVEVRGNDNAATSPLNTLIGGTGAGEGNIIRYNDLDGVRIRNVAVDVAILGNSIYDSSQQGIDLWAAASNDNVTSNDSGDGDSGANYLMNYPVITTAIENAGNIDVNFDLDVTAGNYRVEFFKNPTSVDPSGNGEGETYMGHANIAHGGSGSESFATSFAGALGDVLSATATEEISGPAFRNTSEFSATYTVTAGTAVVDAIAEISPNDVATAGGTYLFEYDIAATIGAANTGVDRVAITVPGSFGVGASPVTNVLVDGFSVAFTDNTVGNAISVDLTTKVTTNARITVVFDAIAPGTQDLVGVDFTATVDDSATGDAPQDATEGEGDGDTEDNNSWTVTTTGAGGGGGGSCTALDGSPSNLVQAGGGSLTIPHTTSGADRLMVVGVSIALGAGETVSSVTYNGDALTFQGSAQGPGNDSRVEIWTRVAPDVGTFNVVVNLSASTHDGASAGVATFTGVDQATPLGTFASDSGTGGSASFNVSSAAGDVVFGVVAVDDATDYNMVPGGGQAEHWDLDTDELNASGTTEDGAASVTTSWTWSGSDDFAAGGISVKAAGGGCDTAVTSAAAEISPNDVITSSTGNAFAYDIQTTVNVGDTGIDRVAITVPGTFGAPTVSDVLVDGASVSYTDNTSGNDISVDLTVKVTYSARITVLFTSDAPTTQDLTGKDFLSTVDDSGDATAPQSTTEGNGDGDAGDNNDWTVTTTDSGGASCIVDPAGTYIEAENYTALVAGADLGTFTVESSQAGYNGTGYLRSNNGDTGSPPDDMRADYTVEFTTTGTYYIWIRGYALDNSEDSIWIGLDGTEVGSLNEGGNYSQWIWTDSIQSGVNTINIPTAGWYTINLWVRESDHMVDGIYITQDSGAIPGGPSIDIPTPGGSSGSYIERINASTDDAEQKVTSAFGMDLTSSDLELHNSGGDGYVGMRWTGVTIPQGATIDDARIQFHVDEIAGTPENTDPLTVTFVGEDVVNAATFTSTAENISDRLGANETTASVDWAIPEWVNVSDELPAQLSADLSPIVQEIVDQGSWSSGNAMVIMIKAWSGNGERTAESENGEDTAAAQLQIDYSTGGGPATIIDPSACSGGGGIAHFAIIHDGTGINCQAENVTFEAHDSSHSVVTTYAGTMVLSTSTNHGSWSLITGSGSLTSGARGNAVYGFGVTDLGTATLGLRDTFVETTNIDVNSGGMNEHSTEDDDIVFARSGFNFLADSAKNTIGVQIAGKPSNVAPDVQTLELQAVKTNDDTGQCEAALVGANTIDIGFECEDPDVCATNSLSFGGINVPANDNAAVPTYARVSMDFGNASDTTATFTMTYDDVGKIKLYARNRILPSGEEMLGGSNSFVVRPFAFDVTATGNPAATGPSDPVFTTAGAEFTADVTALLWEAADDTDNDGIADNHDDTDPSNNADLTDNAAAPNYGYEFAVEQVLLTAALDQPAGGANPGLAGGTSVTVFTAGTGTTTTVRYDEVGIIEMSAKVSDNDYLGIGATETGKITSKSGYVGRFNPAQYSVTAGDINPACSATFTYARQPFTGSMTIEAQNDAAAGNNRTENYRGAFVTLDPNAELVFINSATTTAYNSQSVTYNQNFDAGNFGEAVLALQFRWDMGEQVPTTSTVQNTGVTDEVNTLASAPVSIGSSPTRHGRAVIGTAAGSELVDLGVVMRTEYYLNSTSGYVVNTDDFCSMGAALSLSNFADNLDLGETCVQDTGNPGLSGAGCTVAGPVLQRFEDPLIAGDANLFMEAPGAGNDGSANVNADVPSWLEFDWDTGVGGLEDPTGHIVFGIYGGDKNQVYRRELY